MDSSQTKMKYLALIRAPFYYCVPWLLLQICPKIPHEFTLINLVTIIILPREFFDKFSFFCFYIKNMQGFYK